MIKFIMGGVDFSDNTSGIQFGKSEVTGGNSFTSANGETVENITSVKLTIKISLSELNASEAESVLRILNNPKIGVKCNFPDYDGDYICSGGYTADTQIVEKTGTIWKIDFTLSRTIPSGGSGGGDGL